MATNPREYYCNNNGDPFWGINVHMTSGEGTCKEPCIQPNVINNFKDNTGHPVTEEVKSRCSLN
jgi:hypothetical protein